MLLRRKPLSASPLLAKQEPLAHARQAPMLGLVLVTTAALLFGVVAACVKAIEMPTLVLQLCRSFIEWALGVGAALFYWRTGAARAQVRQEAELEVQTDAWSSYEEVTQCYAHLASCSRVCVLMSMSLCVAV